MEILVEHIILGKYFQMGVTYGKTSSCVIFCAKLHQLVQRGELSTEKINNLYITRRSVQGGVFFRLLLLPLQSLLCVCVFSADLMKSAWQE